MTNANSIAPLTIRSAFKALFISAFLLDLLCRRPLPPAASRRRGKGAAGEPGARRRPRDPCGAERACGTPLPGSNSFLL